MEFFDTDRITGEVLACKIKEHLTKWDIDFQDCRGQGYDGATNMSAERGVQGRLVAENPKAVYTHCNGFVCCESMQYASCEEYERHCH